MPRFELKVVWSRGLSALLACGLCVVFAAAFVCRDMPCNDPPPAPVVAAPPLAAPAEAPPPAFVSGLPADYKQKAKEAFKAFPQPFRIGTGARDDLRQKTVYLWEAVLQVQTPRKPKGQHYTAGPQLIGSCVAWGGCTGVFYTLANAVVAGNAGGIDDPCQSIQYGITRVTQGKGRPRCGQDGAYPSDFAQGIRNYGWATWGESGLTYSAALETRLGCSGPTREQLALAKPRAGVDAYPIRTLDELLEALNNGYAGTAGIDWSPGRTRDDRGRVVTDFNGRYLGGHQIAWVGWDGERQHLIFHNSHGTNAHPRNDGDPPGSFRVTASTAEAMLQNGEFWAFSSVPGFPPQEIDLTPLRPRKRSAAQLKDVTHADPDRVRNVLWHRPDALERVFDRSCRPVPDPRVLCQLPGGGAGSVGNVLAATRGADRSRCQRGHFRPVCPPSADHRVSGRRQQLAPPAAGTCV